MYLLGGIYAAAYRYMQVSGYSLLSIILYGNVMLSFGFSNLRIVQTLMNVMLATAFFAIFFGSGVRVFRRSDARVRALPSLPERLSA